MTIFDRNNKNEIRFDSVKDFWMYVTEKENWYLGYSPFDFSGIDCYLADLTPLVIQTTNNLRLEMKFSYKEYLKITEWDNWVIINQKAIGTRNLFEELLHFKQFCSNCKSEVPFNQRYPKYICNSCEMKIHCSEGRKIGFYNEEALGFGCVGYYSDSKEEYPSKTCFIGDREFFAQEARFGGIVLQLKERI